MKWLQLMAVPIFALLVGCETNQTAGQGNQEAKRLAAIQQEQQEAASIDEAQANLWNAQQDRMTRESNPAVEPVRP